MWKFLSQGIHKCNMKDLSLLVRKLWPRLKFFKSRSNFQGQGHKLKIYGTMWEVLSKGIHKCNMKALSLLVRNLWPRLKFFKSWSKSKVKVTGSKFMVPCERSCHKEYTYEISIFNGLKVMAMVKVFVYAANMANTDAEADTDAYDRAMTLALRTFIPAC